jgi:hypothetical protein
VRREGTREETWVMYPSQEAHFSDRLCEHVVLVVRRAVELVKGLVEKPVFVTCIGRVTNWETNYSKFIIWKCGMTESMFAVSLL